jgi:hypothetical protein
MEVSERPNGALDRQAPGDLHILEHVFCIIDVDEIVAKRLAENEPGSCSQKDANPENQPTILPARWSGFGLKRRAPAWMAGSSIFSRSLAHCFDKSVVGAAAPNFTLEQGRIRATADILQSGRDRG